MTETNEAMMENHLDNLVGKEPEPETQKNEAEDVQEDQSEQVDTEAEASNETNEESNENDDKQEEKLLEEEKNTKYVNLAALHEEREKRKELSRELNDYKGKYNNLEQQLNEIRQQFTKPAEPEPEPVSFEDDPVAYLENTIKDLKGKVDGFDQKITEQDQAQKRALEEREFIGKYQKAAADFTKENNDFGDAYNYLGQSKIDEYKNLGYTQDEAYQRVLQEEKELASRAFKDGVNPAERIYKLAKLRGFKANTTEEQPKPKESIQELDKKLSSAKSLGTSGGKSAKELDVENLSMEELLNLDDAEYDAVFAKAERRKGR